MCSVTFITKDFKTLCKDIILLRHLGKFIHFLFWLISLFTRSGSRRNGDRFPKQRAPKAQGSRAKGGIGGMLPREI